MTITSLPQITVDAQCKSSGRRIIYSMTADQSSLPLDKTASMPALSIAGRELFWAISIPANAFIIVNGLDTIQADPICVQYWQTAGK